MSDLVRGIMVVIGVAIATGHYGELEWWARRQAAEALAWRRPLSYFFPEGYYVMHPRTAPKAKRHPHAS